MIQPILGHRNRTDEENKGTEAGDAPAISATQKLGDDRPPLGGDGLATDEAALERVPWSEGRYGALLRHTSSCQTKLSANEELPAREMLLAERDRAATDVAAARTVPERAEATTRLDAAEAALASWPRDHIAAIANRYKDTSANDEDAEKRALYRHILTGDMESPQMTLSMMTMSSCALLARGVLREAGVQHDILKAPYVVEHALSDVTSIAKAKGAWVDASKATSALPRKGDAVLLSPPEHVIILVSEPRVNPNNPNEHVIDTVEGGQGDGTKAEAFTRTIRSHDNKHFIGKRPILGWADAERMFNENLPAIKTSKKH
jgi:hypothetical protein